MASDDEEVKLSEGTDAVSGVVPGSPGPDEPDDEESGGGGMERAACLDKLKWCIKPGALIAFCVLQAVWTVYWLAELTDAKDECADSGLSQSDCNDLYDDDLAAFALSLLGYLVITGGCITAIIVNLLNCNDCCGKLDNCLMIVVMVVLLVGGGFYVVGNTYYLVHNDYEDETEDNAAANVRLGYFTTSLFGTQYTPTNSTAFAENCSGKLLLDPVAYIDMFQMMSMAKTLLATLTVFIFAVDLWKKFMEDSFKRALMQNGVLFVVSVMQFVAYAYFGQPPCENVDEVHLMATGYFFIAFASIIYIVYARAPMTDPRQQMKVGLGLALALVMGAAFVGIGMWGNIPTDEDLGVNDDIPDIDTANEIVPGWSENKSFITGYIVLLWALSFQSAVDMGVLNLCGPICRKE